MLYDAKNRRLYTDDLALLKHLACPLNKRWETLRWRPGDHLYRDCTSCGKPVLDLTEPSDQTVSEILERDRATCVHVSPQAKHITFMAGAWQEEASCPAPRIVTAWTEADINRGIERGVRVILHQAMVDQYETVTCCCGIRYLVACGS